MGLDLPELDIACPASVARAMKDNRPDVVVNCAAFTDVDGCESDAEGAFRANAEGPGVLAAACRERGALLLHISTDFVFDGRKGSPYTEEDEPNPLSVYARSKWEGEKAVAAAGGNWIVARTAWLYGLHGKNFVKTMLRLASEREELSVVADKAGSPTWTRDLAEALIALLLSGARGVYHCANAGACSRYEQVMETVKAAGLRTRVLPTDSSAFPLPAPRPDATPLDCSKLARDTGYAMRPWQEAIREYVRSS